ncbi:hypothetical protein FB451DRAFT_1094151 [Mycena latifolia]|nr:hypothetical protein FB451DRAFT_1094151 [Mycena latifolia]
MSENGSLQRAEALWFSPEVVILQAGNRVFRVFTAILKAQSSVFADMFSLPQPALAEIETMEGSPIVKLQDDPDEVEVFLKSIFDSSFFMPPSAKPQFDHTIGILRLSHKYDVPYLRRRALKRLEIIYPISLEEYDIRRNHDSGAIPPLPDTVAALKVAIEVGGLWLLPSIYHNLCKNSMSTIISAPWWTTLGEKEQAACLVGHSAQTQYFPTIIAFLPAPSVGDMCDWHRCNTNRLCVARDNLQSLSMREPLEASDELLSHIKSIDMCESCVEEAKALYAAARKAFWDQLPQMFGLPPWAELEEMRRVALSIS